MGQSCSLCGFRSDNRAVFRREKGGLFGRRPWFCFGCKPFPKPGLGFATLVGAVGLAVFGWWGVAVGDGVEVLGFAMLMSAGMLLGTPLTLAVHELGHAAVAALLRRRVYRICVGTGRMLASFEVGRTQWIVGRDMGMGHVIQIPLGHASRPGDLAVLAAGAAANLILVVLLLPLGEALSRDHAAAAALVGGAVLSNLLAGVGALIPGRPVRRGQTLASDGEQILRTLLRPRSTIDWTVFHDAYEGMSLVRRGRWAEAEAHYRATLDRHPKEPGFIGALMHVVAHSKGLEAAKACAIEFDEVLGQEGETTGPAAPIWSYAWGMAAWSHIRTPSGNLGAAERFYDKALAAGPSPHSRTLRGALRVRMGDRESGAAEILAGLKTLEGPGDRLEFCDFILAEGLETPEVRTTDVQSYAAHLRGGGRKLRPG